MRRKGYRGVGCVKRSLSKCEGICRTYDKIQTSFADYLQNNKIVKSFQCKAKFAEPLVKRLKKLVKSLLVRYFKVRDSYYRLNKINGELYRDNEGLARSNDRLKEENTVLREQNKDYALLRKVFGSRQIDDLVTQAREAQQAKRRQKQRNYER